jgi:hypothetical protein
MATMIAMFTTAVVLLGIGSPALAQGQGRTGGVLDVLAEVLGLARDVRGHVVQHREATLVLRAIDGRVYTINTAGLDAPDLARLREGMPVAVSVKSEAPDTSSMPIAAAVGPLAGQPRKVFRRVEGSVESVDGERVAVKTHEGLTLVLDRARIVGEAPPLAADESATLVYEQEPRLAAVWIDPHRPVDPSASVGSGDEDAPPATR